MPKYTLLPKKTLLIAVFLLVLTAWNAVGYHQSDEHFQILEFAAYKLGLNEQSDLAWEYNEQMRPAFQPALAYVAYQFFAIFGRPNPFLVAFFLRLCSAAFFLLVAQLVYRRYAHFFTSSSSLKYFSWLLLFGWCAVYSGIRFSGENWSGLTMALAMLLYPLEGQLGAGSFQVAAKKRPWFAYLGLGFLLGLAFLLRYQVAIMIVGFLAWLFLVGKEKWHNLLLLVAGGLFAVLFGIVLDYWLYGEWVLSSWNYLAINLIEGKAATFGTAPWWAYFEEVFEKGFPPLSLFYILGTIAFCYRFRRDPITWIVVPFIVVHSILSRKDVRFLFPLLPLLPVLVIAPVQSLFQQAGNEQQGWRTKIRKWGSRSIWAKRWIKLMWFINFGLLASVCLRPVTTEVLVARFIYNHYPEQVTLLMADKNPYKIFALELKYYQRTGKIRIEELAEGASPNCLTAPCLYLTRSKSPVPPENAQLVYSNLPGWAAIFNFGGWLDRMRWWYIYEL